MDRETRELLELYLSRQTPKVDLPKLCFGPQLKFLEDQSLFTTAVTGRRSGKTTACALHLLKVAIDSPNSVCLYITLARTNAKKIIWPMLLTLNREMGLGGTTNESDLSLKFGNGSIIYCSGAATAGEIDRFRGLALKLVYIDESQSFGSYLGTLVDDVLVPACFDNRGQIRLIGTPPPVPVGFYYDAHNNPQWSHHHWTMFDNPWIERKRGESPDEILKQELERKGVGIEDPTIQREVFGRFVTDRRRLVIEYDSVRNHSERKKHKYHVMGIDLGFQDADAIVVLGYGDHNPVTSLAAELVRNKQGLTDLVAQIETLRKEFSPHKIMIDTGGLGLKLAEEMRRRYKIPVIAADKTRKFETIEILNDALRTGRFTAPKDSRFASDANLLEWDFDKMRPDKKVISDRFHSDIVDAVLYAFKESPAYLAEPAAVVLKPGTAAWGKHEQEDMERQLIERLELQNEDEIMRWL